MYHSEIAATLLFCSPNLSGYSVRCNRWRLFYFLPLSLFAFEGEVVSDQAIKPWFTGPILATSGNVVGAGHIGLQPYILGFARTAFYDNHWKSQSIDTLWSVQSITPMWIGLSSRIDFKIVAVGMWNYRKHESRWALGDWSAQINIQVHQDSLPYKNWLPSIKISVRETFPTGKYQKLNPNKLGTDGGGRGTYLTTFLLSASKIYHLSGVRFFSWRLNAAYSLPTNVHVKGYNQYGGGIKTNGTVSPEKFFVGTAAFEYAFTRNWVICCDVEGVIASKTTFKGYPGIVPIQDSNFSPIGVPALNENKASIQYSAAPGIEYNWSEHLGLLAGVWFTFAGKNSSNFTTGVLSFNYYH